MDDHRKQIETIDTKLIRLLSQRMEFSQEIGKSKRAFGLPVLDREREAEVMDNLKALAKENNLSEELIEKLYGLIFEESRKLQE